MAAKRERIEYFPQESSSKSNVTPKPIVWFVRWRGKNGEIRMASEAYVDEKGAKRAATNIAERVAGAVIVKLEK